MSDKELDQSEVLPFSEAPQLGVLGHLLTDKTFFLFAHNKIEAKWFINTLNSKIFEALSGYYEKFQEYPTIETLLEYPTISCEDQNIKNRIGLQTKLALNATKNYSKKWIESRLVEWLQVHSFSSSLERAAQLYNRGAFTDAFNIAREGMRKVDSIVLDPNAEYDASNWQADFTESTTELENALTFGNDVIDKKLNPMAKKGSLLLSDTTILLAPTNIGKTTCLLTIFCHNMLNGKDILFLTHEGRPSDIRDKIWMNLLGFTREELYTFVAASGSDPMVMETIKAFTQFVAERLCWVPVHKAGLSVEEVDAVIRTKIEEKVHKTGKGFDMIVDDYPMLLTTRRNTNGKLEMRHEANIVYGYFVQLALEFKMHSLLCAQTNREGAKVNRGQNKESRLLTPEDMGEAFGPAQQATNIITINRDPVSMGKKLITYFIAKSRSSETGYAVVCKENFGKAMTHSNELGAVWYRGVSRLTDSDRIQDFLTQFKNDAIPESALIESEKEQYE